MKTQATNIAAVAKVLNYNSTRGSVGGCVADFEEGDEIEKGEIPEVEEEVASVKDSRLEIPPIDVEHREELFKAACDHVLDPQVGRFQSAFKWTFDEQIFAEMRLLDGDELGTLFDEADANFKKVDNFVSKLRRTSIVSLLLFLGAFGGLQWSLAGGIVEQEIPFVVGLPVLCVLLAVWNASNRRIKLSETQQLASTFGATFNRNVATLRTKSYRAFEQIRNDGATSDGCGERAEKWNHVALWLDDLRSVYDRYVTTHIWRVRSRMSFWRWSLIGLCWIISVVAFTVCATSFGWSKWAFAAYVIAIPLLIWGWDFGRSKRPVVIIWVETFNNAITGQSDEERREGHAITRSSNVLRQIRDREYQNSIST